MCSVKKKWQFLLRTRTFSCPHRVSPIADLVTKASDQLINTTREQSWRLIDQHYWGIWAEFSLETQNWYLTTKLKHMIFEDCVIIMVTPSSLLNIIITCKERQQQGRDHGGAAWGGWCTWRPNPWSSCASTPALPVPVRFSAPGKLLSLVAPCNIFIKIYYQWLI